MYTVWRTVGGGGGGAVQVDGEEALLGQARGAVAEADERLPAHALHHHAGWVAGPRRLGGVAQARGARVPAFDKTARGREASAD